MQKRLLAVVLLLVCQTVIAQTLAPSPPPLMGGPPPMERQPIAMHETEFTKTGSAMPPFLVIKQDVMPSGSPTTNLTTHLLSDKDVRNNANLFVMLFSPVCDHCENQAIMLGENLKLFKKSKIVLMCGKPYRQYLNNYLLITHNKEHPAINVGVDSTDFIQKTLFIDQMPQMNIYDHNRKLLKIFSGQVTIDSLKQYIE